MRTYLSIAVASMGAAVVACGGESTGEAVASQTQALFSSTDAFIRLRPGRTTIDASDVNDPIPGSTITLTRQATGRYVVFAPQYAGRGAAHVTAIGGDGTYCKLGAVMRARFRVYVTCRNGAGELTDSGFYLYMTRPPWVDGEPLDRGFAFADEAQEAEYEPAQAYNNSGQPVVVTRLSSGRYVVRFHGAGSEGGRGNVQVTAVGAQPSLCVYESSMFSSYFEREDITVGCFDPATGNRTDSDFMVTFTKGRTLIAAQGGYTTTNGAVTVSPTDPAWTYDALPVPPPGGGPNPPQLHCGFDSGEPVTERRAATGRYIVRFPDQGLRIADGSSTAFGVVTSHTNVPIHCKFRLVLEDAGVNGPPLAASVACYDRRGGLTNSRFSVSTDVADGCNIEAFPVD